MISRPTKITLKEFKEQLDDQDGFGKTRRIIFFGRTEGMRWKYRIPMIGRKQECYKIAYHLLFDEQDENIRERFIQEGEFKFPLSFNFRGAYILEYDYLPNK